MLQGSLFEFLSFLFLPIEQSMKIMQDRLAELSDSGKLPEASKEYYRIWIRILEGHYEKLFKSSEYVETLTRTIDALNEFIIARSHILQDALKMYPVPSQKEMDELYKEIYLLKKRIKNLEKKQSHHS